jgi:hypothetical protein
MMIEFRPILTGNHMVEIASGRSAIEQLFSKRVVKIKMCNELTKAHFFEGVGIIE